MTISINLVAILAMLAMAPIGLSAAAPQSAGEKIENGASKTKDAVVKGAKVVGGKTKDGLSKTGEVMTDGWITTRVNARFVSDDLLKSSKIDVDTDKHVVTLTGTVATAAGRTQAGAIARGTEGVRRVVNRLTVQPKA